MTEEEKVREPMKYPGVGTGVYIRKNGKVLMGKRLKGDGKDMWCPPGGKVEMYETWEENCRRETREECGLEIENIKFLAATNDSTPQWGTHFVTLHFVADWKSGEPVDEPGKMSDWHWVSWEQLPEPLFFPARNFVDSGYNPFTI